MISPSDQWLGVELRHFAALQAVASEGSFRRAAVRLGYTQSAVSQQIAALEHIVGERLIERPGGPRAVSLTDAGRLLLRHAEVILARINAAQADLGALSAGESGSLKVGTYQSVGQRILPLLMRKFTADWPQLEIGLVESANDDSLLRLVESGELDLTFSIYPLLPGPFEGAELMRDPYVLVLPADSPLAHRGGRMSWQEIASLPLIGYRQCRSVDQVDAFLVGQGVEPNVIFRSDDNGTIQGLVGAGMGGALMPRLCVDASDHNVTVVGLAADGPVRTIALAWHRDRYRTAASRAFVSAARDICAEIEQGMEDSVDISA
ncbi:MAG TPA: LysR family transcriptional regulator [Chloroflexi bacterium]|jgi:DNA-binding transcriptional LysR family regulator|nr:LysR family transcriptional regulator [Chloroflexota bacterium]